MKFAVLVKKVTTVLMAVALTITSITATTTTADAATKKPAKVKALECTKSTTSKVMVSWSKVKNAKGYQISYSTNESFKNATKDTTKKLEYTIPVDGGATYFVRVRAYKKSNAKKVYGKWSSMIVIETIDEDVEPAYSDYDDDDDYDDGEIYLTDLTFSSNAEVLSAVLEALENEEGDYFCPYSGSGYFQVFDINGDGIDDVLWGEEQDCVEEIFYSVETDDGDGYTFSWDYAYGILNEDLKAIWSYSCYEDDEFVLCEITNYDIYTFDEDWNNVNIGAWKCVDDYNGAVYYSNDRSSGSYLTITEDEYNEIVEKYNTVYAVGESHLVANNAENRATAGL